jgi:hypothetical protein
MKNKISHSGIPFFLEIKIPPKKWIFRFFWVNRAKSEDSVTQRLAPQ